MKKSKRIDRTRADQLTHDFSRMMSIMNDYSSIEIAMTIKSLKSWLNMRKLLDDESEVRG